MWWAVDLLASEYGGGLRAVLDGVYLDELIRLTKIINLRKIGEYKMLLSLIENPHRKHPEKLWELLKSQEKEAFVPKKHDDVGFEALKLMMSKSTKIMVK